MSVFVTLLHKDWRLLRPIHIIGAVLFLLPMLIWLLAALFNRDHANSDESSLSVSRTILFTLPMIGSFICTLFLTSVVTSRLAAHERVDGSAAYLAMLPVSRFHSIMSRLLVGVATVLLPWIAGLVLSLFMLTLSSEELPSIDDMSELLVDGINKGTYPILTSLGFAFYFAWFACGWMWGWVLRSDTLAALLGFLTPLVFAAAAGAFLTLQARSRVHASIPGSLESQQVDSEQIIRYVVLGLALFAAITGTIIAFRRRSP